MSKIRKKNICADTLLPQANAAGGKHEKNGGNYVHTAVITATDRIPQTEQIREYADLQARK